LSVVKYAGKEAYQPMSFTPFRHGRWTARSTVSPSSGAGTVNRACPSRSAFFVAIVCHRPASSRSWRSIGRPGIAGGVGWVLRTSGVVSASTTKGRIPTMGWNGKSGPPPSSGVRVISCGGALKTYIGVFRSPAVTR
jgi:hypothetical protein